MPTELPFLTRVDGVQLSNAKLPVALENWLANLVDIVNEDLRLLELTMASLDARITALGG